MNNEDYTVAENDEKLNNEIKEVLRKIELYKTNKSIKKEIEYNLIYIYHLLLVGKYINISVKLLEIIIINDFEEKINAAKKLLKDCG